MFYSSLCYPYLFFYIKNLCVAPKRAKVIRDKKKSLILSDSYALLSLKNFIGNCFDISSAVNYFNDFSTTFNSYLWKWFSSLICATPEHININTIQRSRRMSFAIVLKSKLNLSQKISHLTCLSVCSRIVSIRLIVLKSLQAF